MKNYKHEGESLPFLSTQKPVVLTPSWDGRRFSNDEPNNKGMTITKATQFLKPPIDKWKIVFFIFIIHGLGTLTPWNMFITAKSYFVDYKLSTHNGTNTTHTVYASNFMQYISFASQIPNLIFNWLNVFVNLGGDLTKRIVYSILVEIVLFIITVVLAMLDTASWPGTFFYITMITVIILNMANGIYQNTIYGMVATLPIKYTGAVVLGSNISGLFATIMQICSSYMFSSLKTGAIYYFITAMLVLLVCFDTYFALPLNKFYRYYESLREKDANKKSNVSVGKIPYWTVFKLAGPQLFNIFFTFFVTLSVFPAIHSDIRLVNTDFFIPSELFTSITCFLTFNLFAMLGSLCTSWVKWPSSKYLVVPVVLRAVFLPLFVFCNYLPKGVVRVLPVFITNEWIYWFIAITMSFSSGYLSSLGMMYAPQTVPSKYQLTAGMFAAAMLITGIFTGVLFSFVFPVLVANLSF
ncbi:equilibrative nucleoside transporter 1 [Teleopsis dalmanni]|uniref:equilibrative nucleoside transporter 1 n=1 Tax=Teleopsis dalmanni TaxID=139649 RepID=UPI0018CCB110|nr:equilibrative nucleoside transporter 1 [Teleopsis dalmanni]